MVSLQVISHDDNVFTVVT